MRLLHKEIPGSDTNTKKTRQAASVGIRPQKLAQQLLTGNQMLQIIESGLWSRKFNKESKKKLLIRAAAFPMLELRKAVGNMVDSGATLYSTVAGTAEQFKMTTRRTIKAPQYDQKKRNSTKNAGLLIREVRDTQDETVNAQARSSLPPSPSNHQV